MPVTYSTLISGTGGNDTIENFMDAASITGGNGDDTIYNSGSNVNINAGTGDDYVQTRGERVTIHGGTGADTITVNGDRNVIYGENDADSIINYGDNNIILAGNGADYVINNGSHASIDTGNDNDTVENNGDYSNILVGLGDDLVNNWGTNLSINGGGGNDSLFNHVDNVNVDGAAGDDVIYNEGNSLTLIGNVGNDTIYSLGDNVSMDGGIGNDSIVNFGERVTINAGAGDDTVDIHSNNTIVRSDGGTLRVNLVEDVGVSIDGARTNDVILIETTSARNSSIVTIHGGAGNDSITLSSAREYIQFADGEGFDTVWGFDGNDTIHWTSGTIDQTLVGTSDVTLVSAKSALTLIDVIGKPITVIDGNGNSTRRTYVPGVEITNSINNTILAGTEGNDTVTNHGNRVIINGDSADDTIVNDGNDVTINAGEGNDTILNEGEEVIINLGLGADSVFNSYAEYTTINGGRGRNTITNFASHTSINGGEDADIIWNSGFRIISEGDLITSGQYVTINGGDGDDTITTYGPYVNVNGGDRADSINNYGNFASINGGAGDDIIYNRGLRCTLNGGSGYDSIKNDGDYSQLYGGAGNDTLTGSDSAAETFRYSEGDDVITNYGREDTIKLDTTYTSTEISGRDFIIYTPNGSLRLKNAADKAIKVRNVSNRMEILNEDNDELASLAAGDYVEQNLPDGAYYDTERKTIYINSAYLSQLNAGYYADSVINIDASRMRTAIDLVGNDNDNVIRASNGGSIIKSGAGTNTLYGGNGADFFILSANSSNNVIDNYGDGDIIQLSTGHIVDSSISGTDVLLQLSNGFLTIKHASKEEIRILEADDIAVEDDTENDLISNSRNNTTVNGTANNDTIDNKGNYVVINALGGDDYITTSGYHVVVNAGAGNDTINATNNNSVLNGGVGDDYIQASGSNLTIRGGTGSDTIKATGSNIIYDYTSGDGNDLITNYKSTDKLKLNSVSISDHTVDGSDVLLRLGNSIVTLQNAVDIPVTIINTRGEETTETFTVEDDTTVSDDTTSIADDTSISDDTSINDDTSISDDTSINDDTSVADDTSMVDDTSINDDTSISDDTSIGDDTTEGDDTMVTPQDVIKNFMHSLDETKLKGTEALDEAIQNSTEFSSMQEAIDAFIADAKSADSAMEFLNEQCGIILGNADTGAITGADAGGDTVKTKDSIVPEDESATDYPSSTTFKIGGLTVVVPNKSTLTEVQQNIIKGLYNWWIAGSIELNEESYGLSFRESGTTVKRMTVVFDNNTNNKTLAGVSYTYNNSNGKTNSLTLKIPMTYYSSITADDVNGTTDDGYSYLDRTLAHEFTHALMAANIDYFYRLPLFVTEGLAELTHGIDDTRGREIYNLASNPDDLETYLDVDKRTGAQTGYYAGGYMFFRWLAQQSANTINANVDPSDDTFVYADDTTLVDDSTSAEAPADDTTSTAPVDDTTSIAPVDDTTSSVAVDDTTSNVAEDTTSQPVVDDTTSARNNGNIVIADSKGGTLYGGAGDDTFLGGSGKDVFVYEGGDDIIYDYTTSKDKIKFTVEITGVDVDGDDVEFFTDAGTLTVKDAASTKIKVVDVNGKSTNKLYERTLPTGATYNSSHTTVKFDKTFSGMFDADDYSEKVKTLNATKTVSTVDISGNANNNTIKLGTGGGTVDGGLGNDKMYGNSGRDTFIYNGGKDTVYKYTAGQDRLMFDTNAVTDVKVSGSNVTFNFDDGGSLIVNKGKNQTLTIIDNDGTSANYVFKKSTDDFSSGLSNSQFAADYWFINDDPIVNGAIIDDELDELIVQNDHSIAENIYDQGDNDATSLLTAISNSARNVQSEITFSRHNNNTEG